MNLVNFLKYIFYFLIKYIRMISAHAASNDKAILGLSVSTQYIGSFRSEIIDDIACLETLEEFPENTKATAMLARHTVESIHMPVLRK